MNKEQWKAVDQYLGQMLVRQDEALEAAAAASTAANLPAIAVSAAQGKLLMLLARMVGAKRVLEIGTLAGYSTIWLARGMGNGGKLITLEIDQKHAQVARANLERAGLGDVVELILGPALATLPKLAAEKRGPFDLIFIDADKENTAQYWEWSLKLSRPGTIIIVDNVVRSGNVLDEASKDGSVQGIRRALEVMSKEKRITATAIQMVGAKGYDGFAVAMVEEL
jgi:predicted O-methyltransferase YrrM